MKINPKRVHTLAAAALLVVCAAARAGAVDAAGDFLGAYTGPAGGDLDVLAVDAIYHRHLGQWELRSTFAAPIGTTSSAFYVWGVNRGNGTAGFNASLGLDQVLFDGVVILRPNGGNSTVVGNVLPAGALSVVGNELIARFDDDLLPSLGVFAIEDYTWNLWPRSTAFTPGPAPVGNAAAISDFAPDNSNIRTQVVAEPGAAWLAAFGLAGLAAASRRRRH